jgi:condensin complex subunit 3
MALSSFQLFMSQAQNAPTELKVQVLRIILDLLIVYDQEFFSRSEDVVGFSCGIVIRMSSDTTSQAKRITDFLLQMLDSDDSPEAQAVLCTGICKLLLAGIITEPRVGSTKSIPNAPDSLN